MTGQLSILKRRRRGETKSLVLLSEHDLATYMLNSPNNAQLSGWTSKERCRLDQSEVVNIGAHSNIYVPG